MPIDLLEKLAEVPVPPAPPQQVFDRGIHKRINSRLIVGQVLDLLLRGFGFALLHFGKAVLASFQFTLTGRMETPKSDRDLPGT
jgi:hypothetical protein